MVWDRFEQADEGGAGKLNITANFRHRKCKSLVVGSSLELIHNDAFAEGWVEKRGVRQARAERSFPSCNGEVGGSFPGT
jgi:hypothetical protein